MSHDFRNEFSLVGPSEDLVETPLLIPHLDGQSIDPDNLDAAIRAAAGGVVEFLPEQSAAAQSDGFDIVNAHYLVMSPRLASGLKALTLSDAWQWHRVRIGSARDPEWWMLRYSGNPLVMRKQAAGIYGNRVGRSLLDGFDTDILPDVSGLVPVIWLSVEALDDLLDRGVRGLGRYGRLHVIS